jgi:hypothetical protein
MAAVFTLCPVTGQMIATGIETDKVSLSLAQPFVGRVYCEHCKSEHEWSRNTAWLDDGSGELTRVR